MTPKLTKDNPFVASPQIEVINCKIVAISLGYTDRNEFLLTVSFDQGKKSVFYVFTPSIAKLFVDITDTQELSKVEGKYVRILRNKTTLSLYAIAHIIDEYRWISKEELFPNVGFDDENQ